MALLRAAHHAELLGLFLILSVVRTCSTSNSTDACVDNIACTSSDACDPKEICHSAGDDSSDPELTSGMAMLQSLRKQRSKLDGGSDLEEAEESAKPKFKIRGDITARDNPGEKDNLKDASTTELACGVTEKAGSSHKLEVCRPECPLWANVPRVDANGNTHHCSFRCVEATAAACKAANSNEDVPDFEKHICRRCKTPEGCDKCDASGQDRCGECLAGHELVDGKCHFNGALGVMDEHRTRSGFIIVQVVLVVLIVIIVSWLVYLSCLPITNQEALTKALDFRTRTKLHQPPEDEEEVQEQDGEAAAQQQTSEKKRQVHKLWPISTNLTRENVAGPGLVLFFNFQTAALMWAAIVLLAWIAFAAFVPSMEPLWGERIIPETLRHSCIVSATGYENEHNARPAQAIFVGGVYTVSFVLCIVHSVRQLRNFQWFEAQQLTQHDFSATCEGLPSFGGDEQVEEVLKLAFAEELKDSFPPETGTQIVGVSVCWQCCDDEAQLMDAIQMDLGKREAARRAAEAEIGQPEQTPTHPDRTILRSEDSQTSGQPVLPQGDATSAKFISSGSSSDSSDEAAASQEQPKSEGSLPDATRATRRPQFRHSSSLPVGLTCPPADPQEPDNSPDIVSRLFFHPAVQNLLTKGKHSKKREHKMSDADHDDPDQAKADLVQTLKSLRTCHQAFVVFETEDARDRAIRAAEQKSLKIRGKQVTLTATMCEPDTVLWANLEKTEIGRRIKLFKGIIFMFMAVFIWAVVFYSPCAYFLLSFNYSSDDDPSAIASIMLSLIVVVGNALMYIICGSVAEWIGYASVDSREACYVLLYTSAVLINVLMDMAVVSYVGYRVIAADGVPTFSGEQVAQVKTIPELLDLYIVQQMLVDQLLIYCVPSTFIIPFFIEPIATVFVPYWVSMLIVRCHSDITVASAEGYMASVPMDLSRYGDIIVNITLAVLAFFFVNAYVVQMFVALVISHIFIYAWDHYRVLRSIPKVDYAMMNVDWWAQWLLAIPCALLATAAVLKALHWNREQPGNEHSYVYLPCVLAFFGHICLHTVLLRWFVPKMKYSDEQIPSGHSHKATFRNTAKRISISWFNSNPVQCLRSQHIYEHDPPLIYCWAGKEHLLEMNDSIGAFYEEQFLDHEEYGFNPFESKDLRDLGAEIIKEAGEEARHVSQIARCLTSDVLPADEPSSSSFSRPYS